MARVGFFPQCHSPVKREEHKYEHCGHNICKEPHQAILFRGLKERERKREEDNYEVMNLPQSAGMQYFEYIMTFFWS